MEPEGEAGPAGHTPSQALESLLEGNRRFVEGRPAYGHDISAATAASGEQHPIAAVVGCLDSRVPLEAVFDQGFGAIGVIRSGGQVLDRAVTGSIEFAVSVLRTPLVLVLGHQRCGAVHATINAVRTGEQPPGDLGYLVDKIIPAVQEAGVDASLPDVVRVHVRRTVAALRRRELFADLVQEGRLMVAGAVYDLGTGTVTMLD